MPVTDECFLKIFTLCNKSKSNGMCTGERVQSLGFLLLGDFEAILRKDRSEAAIGDNTASSQFLLYHNLCYTLLRLAVKTQGLKRVSKCH